MITDGPIEMFWRDFRVGQPVINIIPCRSTRVGPSKIRPREMKENAHHCLKKNADDHEWAQLFQWENLPTNLNGPIHFLQKPADVFEWAHSHAWRKLPMSSNGPIHFLQKTADNFEWAHSNTWGKFPMSSNGPSMFNERNFRWAWLGPFPCMNKTTRWARMGPACSMRETVGDLERAHSYT